MNISFVASRHRKMIVEAMEILMYAVATPVSRETDRKACVYFRPKQQRDNRFFRITYGSGCSATVRKDFYIHTYALLMVL